MPPDFTNYALVATLPDPRHGDVPLTVFVALEEHDPTGWAHVDLDIARELRPTWRTGWQVFDGTGLVVAQGALDTDGREMQATVVAVADELASVAELASGKTSRRPVVLIRGASLPAGSGSVADDVLMPPEQDLFT